MTVLDHFLLAVAESIQFVEGWSRSAWKWVLDDPDEHFFLPLLMPVLVLPVIGLLRLLMVFPLDFVRGLRGLRTNLVEGGPRGCYHWWRAGRWLRQLAVEATSGPWQGDRVASSSRRHRSGTRPTEVAGAAKDETRLTGSEENRRGRRLGEPPMSSTDERNDFRIAFDVDDRFDAPHWVLGLAMAAAAAAMVFSVPASATILQRTAGVLMSVLMGGLGLLVLFPAKRSDVRMVYFDFFGRINPMALARKRGPLAIAARVLEENRAALKRQFTVITAAGRDRNNFPKGRDPMWPRYVALASNREPIALFFFWGACGRSILIHEYHYGLATFLEERGEVYYFPELRIMRSDGRSKQLGRLAYSMGSGLRRELGIEHGANQIRKRLRLNQVTPENVQQVIDEFVDGKRRERPASTLPCVGRRSGDSGAGTES